MIGSQLFANSIGLQRSREVQVLSADKWNRVPLWTEFEGVGRWSGIKASIDSTCLRARSHVRTRFAICTEGTSTTLTLLVSKTRYYTPYIPLYYDYIPSRNTHPIPLNVSIKCHLMSSSSLLTKLLYRQNLGGICMRAFLKSIANGINKPMYFTWNLSSRTLFKARNYN